MYKLIFSATLAGILFSLTSCNAKEFDTSTGDSDSDGDTDIDSDADSDDDTDSDGDTDECGNELSGTIRDFKSSHSDFESSDMGQDPGIVEDLLGPDGKPVYAGGTNGTTHGQDGFDQWYRDVADVNMADTLTIILEEESDGVFSYDSDAFFPIDGELFGDEGNTHNYHFTYEMHARFTYFGGEIFEFRGDDDLWIFVNNKLALDIGGVHGPLAGTIDFDEMATQLDIEIDNEYQMDIFFAERHTSQSNFRIVTTIECFEPPPV